MERTRVNENVRVYALYNDRRSQRFPHNRLQPIVFVWRNREYRIQNVTYVWREKNGESDIYHYAVSDGANVYELSYEAQTFKWVLDRVSCE